MNKEIPKKFAKRFSKFKNINLPCSFYDKERNVSEYCYHDKDDKLCYSSNLLEPFTEIVNMNFYYTYHGKYFVEDDNDKIIVSEGFCFTDSFEEVIESVYYFPEAFKILPDDEKCYSTQQLQFLKRLKNYLLLIGLKDLIDTKISSERLKNELQDKYKDARIFSFKSEYINDYIAGKYSFDHKKYILDSQIIKKEDNKTALIVDENENFRLYIRFLDSEVKKYKDIKHIVNDDKFNDDDKVILRYFEIIEIFK